VTVDELRRLLIAPEIIVLDVTGAALVALERALLLEHPLLHAPSHDDDPLVRQRARSVVHLAHKLRRAVRSYRGVVDAILREANHDDSPF
jgi:hypothetical protein